MYKVISVKELTKKEAIAVNGGGAIDWMNTLGPHFVSGNYCPTPPMTITGQNH